MSRKKQARHLTRVYAVLIEPQGVRTLLGPSGDNVGERIGEAIGSAAGIAYPAQYGKTSLRVLADEEGMYKPLPYNRWGIVGTFAVVSSNNRPLSDKQVDGILADVEDRNGGYLDETSHVCNAFREAFREHGVPPPGAVPQGPAWFA